MAIVGKILETLQARQRKLEKEIEAIKAALPANQQLAGFPQPPLDDQQFTKQAQDIILKAKDEALRIKSEAENEAKKIRQELFQIEERILQKEESLDKKLLALREQEEALNKVQQTIDQERAEVNRLRQELLDKLEKVAALTREEAKKVILDNLEKQLTEELAQKIRFYQTKLQEEAKRIAQDIVVDAMLHGATDWVAEYTVSTVKLPSEDIKGRIIGKEGRNIRTFELATGVDVELDPEATGEIRLSSFDPVRREIARRAMERLIIDGRIQPVRIEREVERARKEVYKDMSEEGRKLAYAVGVYNLDQELTDMLGRLKFRYSYGQNQWIATLETAKIGKKIAQEIGADVNVVTLGCLFHDIGKVITDKEGTHVQLGVEFLKRKNMPQAVIDCVAQHHEDEPFTSIESKIVHIADAISGARPGARHEDVQDYIKRLNELEQIALSFKGVDKAYAFAAGREVWVIVRPEDVSDSELTKLSHDIAADIEKKMSFPGQVTVTVIREKRAEATTLAQGA